MSAEGGPGSARLWAITLLLAVTAAVLGYVGLGAYLPGQGHGDAGVWERLYYTAQMFVLGAVPVDKPPINGPLLVALFLAPLTTVLAVLQAVSTVFRAQYVAWRLRHAHGHAVVVGAGPAAFVLAQRLAKRPRTRSRWRELRERAAGRLPGPWRRRLRRRVRAATTVLVGSDVTADVARRHGLHVVPGDPMDSATLEAAGVPGAAEVFALSDTDSDNAAVALLTRRLHQERLDDPDEARGRRTRPLPSVAVYARADDAPLVAAMRLRQLDAHGSEPDGYTLDFFGIEQRAAVALVDQHDDVERAAVVVGSDSFARAVETELRLRRRRRKSSAAVTLVPLEKWQTVRDDDVARIYVSAADPDEVMSTGLQLALYGCRVVLCLGRRSLLADALEKPLIDDAMGNLTVFGVLDEACDPERLRHRALVEQLARALHAHYLRNYPAPEPAVDPVDGVAAPHSHMPWEDLAEQFRADNRAQAAHVTTKLAAIGAVVVPQVDGMDTFTFGTERDEHGDDEVERLARMEHERWMQPKTAAGVRWGPDRTPTTHPDYLPWRSTERTDEKAPGEPDELSEKAREKDRVFIRELPALLADEGLAIVRRPAEPGRGTT